MIYDSGWQSKYTLRSQIRELEQGIKDLRTDYKITLHLDYLSDYAYTAKI